nr:hypothetical protein [Lysinibacillus timonensis]
MSNSFNYKEYLRTVAERYEGRLTILDIFEEFRKVSSDGAHWYQLLKELANIELETIGKEAKTNRKE